MLNLRDDVHINAAILVFTCRCQTLSVFNGRQDNGVRGDRAFDAIHTERQTEAGGKLINQCAFRPVLQ